MPPHEAIGDVVDTHKGEHNTECNAQSLEMSDEEHRQVPRIVEQIAHRENVLLAVQAREQASKRQGEIAQAHVRGKTHRDDEIDAALQKD